MSVNDKTPVKVPVYIDNDFIYARDEWKDASKQIFNADASPDAERLLFSARGDVFSVPAEKGLTLNLTQTPGVHEREAAWSPDGKYVAYLSDETGEFELYMKESENWCQGDSADNRCRYLQV